MALSKIQGAQIETPVDISAVNLTGVTTAAQLNVGTGGTVITTTDVGLVGIGSTQPNAALEVHRTTDMAVVASTKGINNSARFEAISGDGTTSAKYAYIRFNNNDSNNQKYAIGTYSDDNLTFRDEKANLTRIILDPSGNIGIATFTANSKLSIGDNLGSGYVFTGYSTTVYGAVLRTRDTGASTAAAFWVTTTPDGGQTSNNLFRVQNDGKIGIGTIPQEDVDILGKPGQTLVTQLRSDYASEMHLYTSSDSSAGDGVIRSYRSRGTLVSPSAVQKGDSVGRPFVGYAYDGSSYSGTTYIQYSVDDTPSGATIPTKISFFNRNKDGDLNEQMTINSDGSVGIGSTAAKRDGTKFIVSSGNIDIDRNSQTANPRLYFSHNLIAQDTFIELSRTQRSLSFYNNGYYNLNIGAGRTVDIPHSLTVGISSTFAWQSGMTMTRPTIAIGSNEDSTTQNALVIIKGYDGDTSILSLQTTSGATDNTAYTETIGTTPLGLISFEGVNSSNIPYPAATIRSTQVGNAGASFIGGDLRFHISRTNDGLQEFARMSHNNNNVRSFLIGSTGISFAEALVVTPNYNGSTQNYGIAISCTGTSNSAMRFANGNGIVGSISMSGSATAYNTSSDYRLKENISTITDGLSRLMQLNPIRFNWISDETDTQVDGFLAHEVSPVVPESINGEKDEMQTDEEVLILNGKIHSLGVSEEQWNAIVNDPNRDYNAYPEGVEWRASFTQPKYQGIDQAKLVPLLVAALKELTLKVNTLEAAVGIAST